jgi:hypothetical protein
VAGKSPQDLDLSRILAQTAPMDWREDCAYCLGIQALHLVGCAGAAA